MKRIIYILSAILFLCTSLLAQTKPIMPTTPPKMVIPKDFKFKPIYDSVPGDPMKTRIYTIANGLKVYLSVNKSSPQIQTFVVTRAGSKNDPSDATGLAHYLEHMLFKGTDKFGTLDYEKEKPLLDKIEAMYETYRATKDKAERAKIYKSIDSLSGIAAKYGIANEYDKMIASIGGDASNAFTWYDMTAYLSTIPSNQLENWATIESERFRNPILRIFHTELEAVYEEKNMTLEDDNDKISDAIMGELFKNHTYGTQTTIGTIEHLKNPSITKIKEYYKKYYVPNNMAICLSGDFDPNEAMSIIIKKFGNMKAQPVSAYQFKSEEELKGTIVKEVVSSAPEQVRIGYRLPGANSREELLAQLLSEMLYNGTAGVFDIELRQAQKVLDATSSLYQLSDYNVHFLGAQPREGQKLEEAKDLLLSSLQKIKEGKFESWLMPAAATNLKLKFLKQIENNEARNMIMLDAFIRKIPLKTVVGQLDELQKVTKEELVAFVNKYYTDKCVVTYKRQGREAQSEKVEKPSITPVEVNREAKSPFYLALEAAKTKELKPHFVDYKNDFIKKTTTTNFEIISTKNKENELFTLDIKYPFGFSSDARWNVVKDYFELIGTDKISSAQLKNEFYKLGTQYELYVNANEIDLYLTGLNRNFKNSIELISSVLTTPANDPKILEALKSDILKQREDAHQDKDFIVHVGLNNYSRYGKAYSKACDLSNEKVKSLTSDELVSLINSLLTEEHTFLYNGPFEIAEAEKQITSVFTQTKKQVEHKEAPLKVTDEFNGQVYVYDFPEMKQAEIFFTFKADEYDTTLVPVASFYNDYFGGGMAAILFQTLRESKALAYSTHGKFEVPLEKGKPFIFSSFIGTQSDKLPEATAGMLELINELPYSENVFIATKKLLQQNIASERLSGRKLLGAVYQANKLGYQYDPRIPLNNFLNTISKEQLMDFAKKHIANKKMGIFVLGSKESLDMKALEKYGKVNFLTFNDLFAY